MRIVHLTEASSAGVLSSVTALARAQAASPDVESVALACVARADSPPAEEIAALCGEDVAVQVLPCRAGRRELDLLGLLRTTLRADPAALIHLHSSRAGFLGRLLARLGGTASRVVYSPHCFSFDRADLPGPVRTAFRGLELLALPAGHRLLLVSESEAALARRALPGARVATLSNAVDTAACRAAARSAEHTGALRVVHIGRIAGQKLPAEFSAVAEALSAPGEVEFRWIGEGDRERLSPVVSVTGWLSATEVRAELAAADLVLFTSGGEGMPMSLLEAQAMGLPVVAHPVTGVSDIVLDGTTGLLRESTAELVTAVSSLLGAPDTRQEMSRAAARRMQDHFDVSDLAARSLAAYTTLGVHLPTAPVSTEKGSRS